MPRIEGWSISESKGSSPHTAPEHIRPCLAGMVYDHPVHEDGQMISTSGIVDWDSETCTVTTQSGSEYQIGEPSDKYVSWCSRMGYDHPWSFFDKWNARP